MLDEVTASHHQPLISYKFDIFVTVSIKAKGRNIPTQTFHSEKKKNNLHYIKEGDHSINISLAMICSSLLYLYIPIYYLWSKSEVHQP